MKLTMKEKRRLIKGITMIVVLVMIACVMAFPVFALAEDMAIVLAAEEGAKKVIDLTAIVTVIFDLICTLIAVKLIPLIKSKTTAEQQAHLQAIINSVVYAAEQLFGAGRGEEKLDYALSQLEEMGIKIDKPAVRVGIEAAVKALNLTQDDILAKSILTIPDIPEIEE